MVVYDTSEDSRIIRSKTEEGEEAGKKVQQAR
jgi:hypothetical protein